MDNALKRFYDDHWNANAEAVPQGHERAVRAALKSLGDLTGRRILDVGCGNGFYSRLLMDRGAEVTAVDLSESAAAASRQKGVNAFRCDVLNEDVRQKTGEKDWEVIWLVSILMHVDPPAMIRALSPLLAPGGRIVSIDPIRNHPLVILYRKTLSGYRAAAPRHISLKEHRAAFEGMAIEEARVFHLLGAPLCGLPPALRRTFFVKGIEAVLGVIDDCLLRLLAPAGWISLVIAKKR